MAIFVMFEHGPQRLCSTVGCGVDYAHLHIVPTNFDLKTGIHRFFNLNYKWQNLVSIQKYL